MKIPLLFALGGTLIVAPWAQAQPNSPLALGTAPSVQTGKQTFKLTLKNVKPSIMAYWLDPDHHEKPSELQDQAPDYSPRQPFINGAKVPLLGDIPLIGSLFSPKQKPFTQPVAPVTSSPPNPELAPKFLQLPARVDRIVAIDPQNALLVFGTTEGVKALEERVAVLDKPLQKVEIEARIVNIRRWDISEILPDVSPESPFQRVDSKISEALESHLKANEASVIASPGVQGLNKLRATLYNGNNNSDQGYTTFIRLPRSNTNDLVLRGSTVNIPSKTNYAVQLTPSINTDGTVTMTTYLTQHQEVSFSSTSPFITNTPARSSGFSTTVHDGETIAFFEFATPETTKTDYWFPIVFVTAHIVKPSAQ